MGTGNKRIALEEVRLAFERHWSASDILDGKLQNILNFSSVIVAIGTTVMGSTLLEKVGIAFWLILILVLVMYSWMLYIILKGLSPRSYAMPISEDEREVSDLYYQWPEDRAIRQSIHDYLEFTKLLVESNSPKVNAIKIASVLMGIIVILLLVSIPIGILFSTPTLPCFFHLSSCITGAKP